MRIQFFFELLKVCCQEKTVLANAGLVLKNLPKC
jgi:hypothetical protein